MCRRRCLLTLWYGKVLWTPCEGTDGQLYDLMELLRYARFKGLPIQSAVDPSQDLVEVRLCCRRKPSLPTFKCTMKSQWNKGKEEVKASDVLVHPGSSSRTLMHALPKTLISHAPSAALWLTTDLSQ